MQQKINTKGIKKKHSLFELFSEEIKTTLVVISILILSAIITYVTKGRIGFLNNMSLALRYIVWLIITFIATGAIYFLYIALIKCLIRVKSNLRLRYLPINNEEIKSLGILNLYEYLRFIDSFLLIECEYDVYRAYIPQLICKEIQEVCFNCFDCSDEVKAMIKDVVNFNSLGYIVYQIEISSFASDEEAFINTFPKQQELMK